MVSSSRRLIVGVALGLVGCGEDYNEPGLLPPGNSDGGCVPSCTGNGTHGATEESDGSDEDFECGEKTVTPQLGRAGVLLVLDQSGSMSVPWDHDADPETPDSTRWAVLHALVVDIVQSFDGEVDLGASMFPSAAMQCGVDATPEVPVAEDSGAAILALLPAAGDPPSMSETPTVSALLAGRAHLQGLDGEGPRAMVLVTDGEPTCGQGLVAAAEVVGDAYQEDGILTYAVGLAVPAWAVPGFEAVAEAGGAPASGAHAFYDIQSQVELEEAVADVAQGLQTCAILLDPEPELPEQLEVRLDGELVPRVEDCASDDGWVWAEPEGPYAWLRVCGSFCAQIEGEEVELIADYACPSVMPGP